jgi:hypothetical protein
VRILSIMLKGARTLTMLGCDFNTGSSFAQLKI